MHLFTKCNSNDYLLLFTVTRDTACNFIVYLCDFLEFDALMLNKMFYRLNYLFIHYTSTRYIRFHYQHNIQLFFTFITDFQSVMISVVTIQVSIDQFT